MHAGAHIRHRHRRNAHPHIVDIDLRARWTRDDLERARPAKRWDRGEDLVRFAWRAWRVFDLVRGEDCILLLDDRRICVAVRLRDSDWLGGHGRGSGRRRGNHAVLPSGEEASGEASQQADDERGGHGERAAARGQRRGPKVEGRTRIRVVERRVEL